MVNISVIPDIGFNFGAPINELIRVWSLIESHRNSRIVVDFSRCRFSNPLFLQGVFLLYRHYLRQGLDIEFNLECRNEYFFNYLDLNFFKEGFKPENYSTNDFSAVFEKYRHKTYLPLTNFPAGKGNPDSDIRDRMLELMTQKIRQRLSLDSQLYNAVTYLIDEAVNNIKDHAETDRGYFFTQFYPRNHSIDLCIADTGVGILESYKNAQRTEIRSDSQAIQAALSGDSTKHDVNRGFGIRTSRKMLVRGLGGNYFLMSGSAFILSSPGYPEEIRVFPEKPRLDWPGTYVAMRIPLHRNVNFRYNQYLE